MSDQYTMESLMAAGESLRITVRIRHGMRCYYATFDPDTKPVLVGTVRGSLVPADSVEQHVLQTMYQLVRYDLLERARALQGKAAE